MVRARNRRRLAVAALLAALGPGCAPRAPAPPPPAPPPPPPEVVPAPPPCERIVLIQVHKAERELVAHCARGGELRLRVALGREPEGHKLRAGDRRTPEGLYHVLAGAKPSRFHRFVPIDYPSPADAEAALREGRIDPADHARILRAHATGRPPPADTPLGGDLGFHGEGPRWRGDSAFLDWTYGCVALRDEDVDLLAERAPPGTPVVILPASAAR